MQIKGKNKAPFKNVMCVFREILCKPEIGTLIKERMIPYTRSIDGYKYVKSFTDSNAIYVNFLKTEKEQKNSWQIQPLTGK